MTGPVTSRWLGEDVVLLRGSSTRRAYAALALAVRELAPRRNGLPLPADLVADLKVLRQAAEHAQLHGVSQRRVDKVSQMPAGSSWGGEDLVDATEVARSLEVSVQYARRMCQRGRFKSACRDGREWRVSAAEVEAYAGSRSKMRSA